MRRLDFANVAELLPYGVVKIGIAVSGGGYRAMLSGAGVLSAYDIRTPGAEEALGGIYQSASYIAGNSGGLWLVANNLLNDGEPIHSAICSQAFDSPLIEGFDDLPLSQFKDQIDHGGGPDEPQEQDQPITLRSGKFVSAVLQAFFTKANEAVSAARNTPNVASTVAHRVLNFYRDLNIEVRVKKDNGFKVSLTDYWGRAVSKKVFPEGKRMINMTLSSVSSLESFRNFSQPFPIFGSIERLPGTYEGSPDSHVFEFTPFEFGSWDSNLNSFVDLRYLGTSLVNGVPSMKTKDEKYSLCVSGYDNFALVVGTSSSLFNTFFHYVYRAIFKAEETSLSFLSLVLAIFGLLSEKDSETILHPEYAVFSPNPFYQTLPTAGSGRSVTAQKSLFIVDGGDDGQNIPFQPLLVRSREVEVIFAFDASADDNNFPNGTSLVRTAQRFHAHHAERIVPVFDYENRLRSIFPNVPDQETYTKEKLGERPVFLGCHLTDFPYMDDLLIEDDSGQQHSEAAQYNVWSDYLPPLVVYHANYNHTFASNSSTFRTTYTDAEVIGMVQNGYNVASYPKDETFKKCVGCVLMKRRVERLKREEELPQFCAQCFQDYCWRSSH